MWRKEMLITFPWHAPPFDLPEGAIRLFSSEATANQAFLYQGHVIGLQFHPEVLEPNIRAMVNHVGQELDTSQRYVQSDAEMLISKQYFEENERLLFAILDYLTAFA